MRPSPIEKTQISQTRAGVHGLAMMKAAIDGHLDGMKRIIEVQKSVGALTGETVYMETLIGTPFANANCHFHFSLTAVISACEFFGGEGNGNAAGEIRLRPIGPP